MIFFHLTEHAKQRLRERHDRWLLPYRTAQEFTTSCRELFARAEFTNSHLNDTAFMMQTCEKYGYDKKFQFKEWKNVLFIIVDDVVLTVLDTDEHRSSRQHGRKKRY